MLGVLPCRVLSLPASTSAICFPNTPSHTLRLGHKRAANHGSRRRSLNLSSACAASLATTASAAVAQSTTPKNNVEELKLNILSLVAGLDRGVAAGPVEAEKVLEAVEELEKQASLRSFQDLTASPSPSPTSASSTASAEAEAEAPKWGLQNLDGLWRLVYSSGFISGSLGGLRPGPPTGRLPIRLGQVFQRINVPGRQLDNVVELGLGILPWPLPVVDVTASLEHSFEPLGSATLRIKFDRTTVNVGGLDSQSNLPSFSTPQLPEFLRPPAPARSGQFETTYLDESFRVSRGDLGELRVFVRA